MVRNYVRKTDKSSYSKDKLREAVQAIKSGQLSGYKAALLYKIPRMTLMDHVNNKRFKTKTLGRSTALSLEVEERLASCLHLMEKNGFGLSKQELLEMVGDFVRLNNLSTPFKDNVPGEAWFYGFKKRHNLSVKKPQGVEYARKKAIDPFVVYPYYHLLEKTIKDLKLENKPSAIWNLDETSFSTDPSKTKIVGAKGHAATRVISSPGRNNTTVLLGVNALGEKTPPLIIFKGKNVWDEWTSPDGYPGTTYAATTKGWMETPVFESFFKKTFLTTIGNQRPILLIYDGHSTHVSLNIIEEARKQNITILKLPPHSSHVLQPLDVAVMKSFKDQWDPLLVKWQRLNVGITIPKKEFARLIGVVWRNIDPKVIINGFKKTGTFPPCREKVPEKDFDALKLKRWKECQPRSLVSLCLHILTKNKDMYFSKANKQDFAHTSHLDPHTLTIDMQINHTQPNQTNLNHLLPLTSPSPHTTLTFTCKPLLLTKINNQLTSNEKTSDRIQILDNVKVKVNFTFEELLLSKVKAGNPMKAKRRKIAEGAEIITHDDVRRRIMEETITNIKKKSIKQEQGKKKNARNYENKAKRGKTKQKDLDLTSESEGSIPEYDDESDYENIQDFCEDILAADNEIELDEKENVSDNVPLESILNTGGKSPRVGNWLLVKFATKKTVKHYVGVVIEINSDQNPIVQYLRKANRRDSKIFFSYPHVEDISELRHVEDIVSFLPEPVKERRGLINFEGISLKNYNIQ